jgi:general secretion pathway protein D
MVINSAASADIREKILTFDVQNIPLESIARIFVKTLEKQGIVVVLDNGIYAVTGAQESELVITRLQNRSADYVRMIVQQAFPDVALEKKSMVVTPTQSQSSPPAQSAPGMPQQAASPVSPPAFTRDAEAPEILVFRVPRREAGILRDLLKMIDAKSDQVFVRAVAYDVQTDNSKGSALDVAVSLLGSKLNLNLNSGGLTGASSLSIRTGSLVAIAEILDMDARFMSVSRPSVRVRSGSKARFLVGQEVPTLGGVTTNVGGATQSVVYKQAGTVFEVSPIVRPGGIDIIVKQSISAVSLTDSSTLNSPTINKRELDTELTVQSGDVVILAGLDSDDESDKDRGFFGFALSRTKSKTHKQSLLVLEVLRI